MEENQNTTPIQDPVPEQPPVAPLSPSDVSKSKLPIFIIGIILFLLIAGSAAGFYVFKQKSLKTVVKPTLAPSPAEVSTKVGTPDPTANWKTYATSSYSMQYPNNWSIEKNGQDSQTLYDPTSMQNTTGNGGQTYQIPTKYVAITSFPSTETPKQHVDKITSYGEYMGVTTERKSVTIAGLTGEILKAAGEGSRGYYLIVSNGKEIVSFNIPSSDLNSDPIINQILSTFRFTN